MRRVLRIVVNSGAVLSLVLCLATAVAWVRGYSVADAWGWTSGKRAVQCGLAGGRLRIDKTIFGDEGGTWGDSSFVHSTYRAAIDPPSQRLPARLTNLGFAREHRIEGRNYESWLVLIPL